MVKKKKSLCDNVEYQEQARKLFEELTSDVVCDPDLKILVFVESIVEQERGRKECAIRDSFKE